MIGRRQCVICGKDFIPRAKNQQTCSSECAYENQKRIRREVYRKHKNEHKNKHEEQPKAEHLKWDNDYGKRQAEQTLAMVGKVEK